MEKALIIEKAWGFENVLVNEPEYCCKILNVLPNKQCSLHYHTSKKETFVVRFGRIILEKHYPGGKITCEVLQKGESRTIAPGTPHRFSSAGGAYLLEVSTHHDDADVVRLEPSGPCS